MNSSQTPYRAAEDAEASEWRRSRREQTRGPRRMRGRCVCELRGLCNLCDGDSAHDSKKLRRAQRRLRNDES